MNECQWMGKITDHNNEHWLKQAYYVTTQFIQIFAMGLAWDLRMDRIKNWICTLIIWQRSPYKRFNHVLKDRTPILVSLPLSGWSLFPGLLASEPSGWATGWLQHPHTAHWLLTTHTMARATEWSEGVLDCEEGQICEEGKKSSWSKSLLADFETYISAPFLFL